MSADPLSLLRLLQISDSAFPSGGFAFSNGIETLAQERRATGAEQVSEYIATQLLPRWARFDRWFLTRAVEVGASVEAILELDRLCEACNTVAPLAEASRRMGLATLSSHARIGTPRVEELRGRARAGETPGHLPVAQGVIAAALELPGELANLSAGYQLVNGALSSAVRLGLIGALEAQAIQARLAPQVSEALESPLDAQPCAFAPYADIAAMRHGAGEARLFAA